MSVIVAKIIFSIASLYSVWFVFSLKRFRGTANLRLACLVGFVLEVVTLIGIAVNKSYFTAQLGPVLYWVLVFLCILLPLSYARRFAQGLTTQREAAR